MKNFVSFFAILIIATSSLYAQKVRSGQYTLVWQDNFEGSELNTNNWNIEVNGDGGGNRELQYYRKENISIGNEPSSGASCLIITAKKENYSGKTVTSGRLTTQNKVNFKYGKIEARIKLPRTANGLWPAFWLLGSDFSKVGWPRSGEIDIMEVGHVNGIKNKTQDYLFNGACHWGYYQPAGWYPSYAKEKVSDYSLVDDFHLYTLIWDSESIKMYLDIDKYPNEEPYFEIGITDKSSDISTYYYFNKPFFVILNLAVGGNFTQIWNIDEVTALSEGQAKMYVDYVRLYQGTEEDEEYDGPELSSITEESVVENSYQIYPNPSSDYVNIQGESSVRSVEFISLSGKKVLSSSKSVINVSGLTNGYYIVKIEDLQNKTETHPFIKE